MTQDDIREETRRRLAEVDADLARDEQEVNRQMPDVHRRMIDEAEIAEKHYERIAREAMSDGYRKRYQDHSERWKARGDLLRAIQNC